MKTEDIINMKKVLLPISYECWQTSLNLKPKRFKRYVRNFNYFSIGNKKFYKRII
jgi:hypothetical protein